MIYCPIYQVRNLRRLPTYLAATRARSMTVTLRAFWRSLRSLQGARAAALPTTRPGGAVGAPLPPCAPHLASLGGRARQARAFPRVTTARGAWCWRAAAQACAFTRSFAEGSASQPPPARHSWRGRWCPSKRAQCEQSKKRATPRGGHPLACHRCYFVQPKQRSMDAENTASGGYTV